MGFPGGGGGGRFGGMSGLTANKMTGLNYNYASNDEKLELDASARWNHSDGDTWSRSSTESFGTSLFSNRLNQSFSRSNNYNFQMRLEWRPDDVWNIMFRPNLRITKSDNTSTGSSLSFKEDPYLYVADPFDQASIAQLAADGEDLLFCKLVLLCIVAEGLPFDILPHDAQGLLIFIFFKKMRNAGMADLHQKIRIHPQREHSAVIPFGNGCLTGFFAAHQIRSPAVMAGQTLHLVIRLQKLLRKFISLKFSLDVFRYTPEFVH